MAGLGERLVEAALDPRVAGGAAAVGVVLLGLAGLYVFRESVAATTGADPLLVTRLLTAGFVVTTGAVLAYFVLSQR